MPEDVSRHPAPKPAYKYSLWISNVTPKVHRFHANLHIAIEAEQKRAEQRNSVFYTQVVHRTSACNQL